MRHPRLTTRRLMALVALLAIVASAGRLVLLSRGYRRLAVYHASLSGPSGSRTYLGVAGSVPPTGDELARLKRESYAYHRAMRWKYERAASRPWESLPPDPPTPRLDDMPFLQD